VLGVVLQDLLPDPDQGHQLAELSAVERADLYRLADVPVHCRIEYEESICRAVPAFPGRAAA
jgi:hypothetical protein